MLRIGFGLLWVIDGLLQAQPAMVGLATQVIKPGSAGSPAWVRSIVDWGTASWTFHPVQAAAAAVWIQLGIGVWMLAVRRGRWSQAAALAGVAWGLVVWVFGEAFGNVFAPGLSFLTGAPGAALLYVVAGALIALPARAWASARLGRWLLAGSGVFLVGMAVLQAWPGRGFWSGDSPLADMIGEMSGTPQPRPLASLVESFGRIVAAHGFAVNLVAVIVLAAAGLGLLSARPRLVRRSAAGHGRAVRGGLGAGAGHRRVRGPGHRPEQHDPGRPADHRRLPGVDRELRPHPSPPAHGPVRHACLHRHDFPGLRKCPRGCRRRR